MTIPRDRDRSGMFADIDGDGTVDTDDTDELLDNIDSELLESLDAFDYNRDDTVDVIDASIHSEQY